MDWTFVSPQNPYVTILTPNVIVFRDWAFGRWLGHEDGALLGEISALHKGPRIALLLSAPREDTVRP